MEETVLLDKRLLVKAGMGLGSLEGHVGISNLGNPGQPKDNSESPDEDGDGEIDPLDILHGALVGEVEENVRAHQGSDHCSNTIEGLGYVDADFGVAWRSTDSDVGVGGCFERTEAVADDEDGDAEAGEGLCDDAGDGDDCAEAVEEQAPDEGGLVAPVAEDPGGMADGCERVCAGHKESAGGRRSRVRRGDSPKVGSLQAGRAGAINVEGVLEVLVEGIEKAWSRQPCTSWKCGVQGVSLP